MRYVEMVHVEGHPLLKAFYPSLDGLRAVAFLLVFVNHISGPGPGDWGWVGVDAFFVLSGFLITGGLYDSLHRERFFQNFYIRRSLRIFPIYYAFWLALACATPLLHVHWNWYLASFIPYLGNLFLPGGLVHHHADGSLLPFGTAPTVVSLGHLWTLCVEEQFYLAWPIVVWYVRRRETLLTICLGYAALALIARTMLTFAVPGWYAGGSPLYVLTPFRVDTMLLGSAVALWLRGTNTSVQFLRRVSTAGVILPCALLAAACLRWPHPAMHSKDLPVITSVGFTLIAVASCCLLLLCLDDATPVAKVLRQRYLVAFGRLAYGLYFYHNFIIEYLRAANPSHVILRKTAVVALILTTALAYLSFRFFEAPFLALKERFAPRPGTVNDPPKPELLNAIVLPREDEALG